MEGLGWRLLFWLLLFIISVVVGEEVGLRYWVSAWMLETKLRSLASISFYCIQII